MSPSKPPEETPQQQDMSKKKTSPNTVIPELEMDAVPESKDSPLHTEEDLSAAPPSSQEVTASEQIAIIDADDIALASLPETHPPSQTPPSPRPKIRHFLQNIFEVSALYDLEEWPNVSHELYLKAREELRIRVDTVYNFMKHKGFNWEKRSSFRIFGETLLQLLWIDWSDPEAKHTATHEVLSQLSKRPQAILDYDQLYCTPDSAERRRDLVLTHHALADKKVLFIGDDDLGSVVLAPHFPGEIHMLDLDQRLLQFVQEEAPNVHRHEVNLILSGIPAPLHKYFDAVFLDPHWEYSGAWMFLNKAIYALSEHPDARIYLSFCPVHLEYQPGQMTRFWKRLASLGMMCEQVIPAFNLYSLDEADIPEFRALIDEYLPQLESSFANALREIPFAFSNMYVLKRIPGHRPHKIRSFFFNWWHSA
ncbi:MAG TPA: hypothetical protein DCE42_28360 [Myxococcales bacterium]|nr:hypothetical protein [Myxococcales bacterium]